MPQQQIIALGGGGFSSELSPVLDDFILKCSGKLCPKICFLPTASGDSDNYQLRFYERFAPAKCNPVVLHLFRRGIIDMEDFLCSQDIIYVGGGNTVNMLAIWREHGVDKALKRAYANGTLLTGISAGSICWFEYGVTDSFGERLQPMQCLGILKGSNCPHYDGEDARRPSYQKLVREGMPAGYAADDGVGLHFINGAYHKAVSSRIGAKAYRVELQSGRISERALPVDFLGESQ